MAVAPAGRPLRGMTRGLPWPRSTLPQRRRHQRTQPEAEERARLNAHQDPGMSLLFVPWALLIGRGRMVSFAVRLPCVGA